MNERIRAIWDRAAEIHQQRQDPNSGSWESEIEFMNLFAELIVKECGQVLVNNTPVVDLVEDWDKGYDRAMNDSIHHIYEHFGLEE